MEVITIINDNLQQVLKTLFDFHFAKRTPNGKLQQIIVEHEKSTIQVGDSEGVIGKYPFFTSGDTINEWQTSMVDGINCFLATGGNASIKVYSGKAAYSTDTWCISGKGEYSIYLYLYLKSIISSINNSYFAGSGLKHLQKESLLLVDLYIPSYDEIEEFNKVAVPTINQCAELFRENKALKNQRDFLLPLLMNGQATIVD
jgi:type I restriction enzyme S subunit